ncbi:MAG: CoA ester lyase [Nitratireductor sp.]
MVYFPDSSTHWRPRRSVLFMPASNCRALEKARSFGCDGLIFDLEDSVAPEMAEAARNNLRELVANTDFGGRERIVRTSACHSPGFDEDLLVAMECRPDAILLPKLEKPGELAAVRARIGRHGPALWAMIESPAAILDIAAIARHGREAGLEALVLGPNDLAKTTGVSMAGGRMTMLPWFMSVIAAARACGLGVLDGVCNDFRDLDAFGEECRQGAAMGFDGKTLIHPAQIESANLAFSPSAQELARARAIVAAFDEPQNATLGAISLDGEMVERLHLAQARRLLEHFQ